MSKSFIRNISIAQETVDAIRTKSINALSRTGLQKQKHDLDHSEVNVYKDSYHFESSFNISRFQNEAQSDLT